MKNSFERGSIRPGIVHFGVGNFHRAHLEYLTDRLLREGEDPSWGICGAMILPQDESLYTRLQSQDGRYTLTSFSPDGNHECRWIDSLVELHWGVTDKEAIISRLASPQTRIITLTITEGGYNLDTEAVRHDISFLSEPQTVFGYVAEGLRRRMAAGLPVTILSCDNLQHNGLTARRSFCDFFERQDPALARWVQDNVTFPNCMVDRITPATSPADVLRLNALNGTDDQAPVFCESFIQWVVEDNFICGRPAWEKVGVQFAEDVSPYENIKLSLLNASHTLLSYPSALLGYDRVDAAMRDRRIVRLVRDFMDVDITPLVTVPSDVDIESYKATLIDRFSSAAISDQVSRLCGDGLSKFAVYVVPNFARMLENGSDVGRLAFLLSCYRKYLVLATSGDRSVGAYFEPHMTDENLSLIRSSDPMDFLSLTPFRALSLRDRMAFVADYLRLDGMPVPDALETIL